MGQPKVIDVPSTEEFERLYRELRTQSALAKHYGVSRGWVQDFIRDYDVKPPPKRALTRATVPDGEVHDSEIMEQELKDLRKRVAKQRKSDIADAKMLAEVRSAFSAVPPRFTAPSVKPARGKKKHVQALLLSDLHCGEVVVPEAVNGLNEFNFEVLQRRMDTMAKSMVSFAATREYPIEELHIWLLGDNLSGNIHEELAETNEFPVAEQCWKVADLLAEWIERLVPHYPKIKVTGVAGNHPRTHKDHSSKQVFDSFDWLGFKIVETRLASYKSISCHFPKTGFDVVQIAGLNILLWHGDGVRSSMPGVPWGGVMRRWNELRKQYGQQGIQLDGLALGHFHQCNVVQGQIFMNGSLIGLNEFGLKNFGSGEKPTQLLLTFQEDKRRLTDVSFLTP